MFIQRLFLKNVRCFDEFEISFEGAGSSILLLGDNGDGKSTILKSLAMGLCDESSAAALFRELPGEYVRRLPDQPEVPTGEYGVIEIDLIDDENCKYRIKTTIKSLEKFERVKHELFWYKRDAWEILKEDEFPWARIFISAYGPGVRTNATSDFQHYLPVDAVYPLFSYSSPLQNPELVIHRLLTAARKKVETPEEKDHQEKEALDKIKDLMVDLLDLASPDHFELTPNGIKVTGHWGTSELSELSDGYQAVINWVLDLLSWWFLRENGKSQWDLSSLRGVVLIDEIEQHLHPRWQRGIFPQLREKFKNIQFIVATHSPLVASANPDIDVHVLNRGERQILRPFGWLAEDVYSLMGVPGSRAEQFYDETIKEFERLDQKKLLGTATHGDLQKMKMLRQNLAKLPQSDPISLTTEISNITKYLKKEI
jgi:predicted ATP-binding protein involved in virulence